MLPTDIKVRCSSIGYIMTDPRSKSEGGLSETCKGHLSDIMVRVKYGRQSDTFNRYTTKGLMVEEDSITLYSRLTKRFYRKNEEQLDNGWITGTPDLYEAPAGAGITQATVVHDVKSSWDAFTFFRQRGAALNKQYFWQLQGYMWLTGAQSAKLAYCLINTPRTLLMDEMRKLAYKMDAVTDESPDYIAACEEMERNMTYDDIPLSERAIILDVARDDEAIARICKRVEDCRTYMLDAYPDLFSPSTILYTPTPSGYVVEGIQNAVRQPKQI